MTPVFFQNFAPPKKAKKNTLASKKRYSSQIKSDAAPVNLLISILHSHEKKIAKPKGGKVIGKGQAKKSASSKRGFSLPLNM